MKKNILIILMLFFLPLIGSEKPFVVLITSYNNAKWYEANLNSVFTQNYSNYRVIYIDDCFKDDTANKVEQYVREKGQESRFQLIRNAERKGALSNIYYGVHSCADEEIIISLDGDDWFDREDALKIVNKAYSSGKVWLTHGSFWEYPQGSSGWSIPVPNNVIKKNAFREFRCPSHLRTFYTWLFKKIALKDLLYQDAFFTMTWDQAMMFPMLEMAGKHHAFIPELIYVYNMANPINDNKVDAELQRNLEAYIRAMPRYKPLKKRRL